MARNVLFAFAARSLADGPGAAVGPPALALGPGGSGVAGVGLSGPHARTRHEKAGRRRFIAFVLHERNRKSRYDRGALFEPGTVLAERFEIERRVSAGGMSAVYRA